MRTTITIDADVAARIRELMRERDGSFKATVNELLRRGLGDEAVESEKYVPFRFTSGLRPGVDLTKALSIVADLENEEFVRKVEAGK